jgi:hypothetical protein
MLHTGGIPIREAVDLKTIDLQLKQEEVTDSLCPCRPTVKFLSLGP